MAHPGIPGIRRRCAPCASLVLVAVVVLASCTTRAPRDTSAPYGISWDTSSVPNGVYTLTAEGTTTAGQLIASAPHSVTVQNDANVLPRTGWIATASNNPGAAANAIDGDVRTRWL